MASNKSSEPVKMRYLTARGLIDAYNAWDLDKVMALRASECIHEIMPKSLQIEPMNNQAYRTYFAGIMPLFRNFKVTINETIPGDDKILVWANGSAETDVGPYQNEYMIIFSFNEAGDKVVRVQEFVDSFAVKTFFPKLRGARENSQPLRRLD